MLDMEFKVSTCGVVKSSTAKDVGPLPSWYTVVSQAHCATITLILTLTS